MPSYTITDDYIDENALFNVNMQAFFFFFSMMKQVPTAKMCNDGKC